MKNWILRYAARWQLIVLLAFSGFALLLLVRMYDAREGLRAANEAHAVADGKRRALVMADLVSDLRVGAVQLAAAREIEVFLTNRALGMSPRYGLSVSLGAIEERFRAQIDNTLRGEQRIYERIMLRDDADLTVVDVSSAEMPVVLPAKMPIVATLVIDVPNKRVVTTAPVIFRGGFHGTVITVSDVGYLTRNLLQASPGADYREILLTSAGEDLPGPGVERGLSAEMGRGLAAMPEGVLAWVPTIETRGAQSAESYAGMRALRNAVADAPLSLVTLHSEKQLHGDIVSHAFFYAAMAFLGVLVAAAVFLDRMRTRTLLLEAQVADSEHRRGEAERHNVALSAEIVRREALEQELRQRTWELQRMAALATDRGNQLGAVFALSPDGFVSFDADDCVNFANEAFCRMAGTSLEDVLGEPADSIDAILRSRLRDPASYPGLERCFATVDGSEGAQDPSALLRNTVRLVLAGPRDTVLELAGVRGTGGAVNRLVLLRDVTNEVEVDRMKSEFLSVAAHELRTPMSSIYGFAELLLNRDFDADVQHELLQTIYNQTGVLVNILNELLDLSRIESRRGMDVTFEPVDVAALAGEIIAARPHDQAKWPLDLHFPATPVLARADRRKLRQALGNVLDNAFKYSPAGGTVSMSAELVQKRNGAVEVRISVADHGIGMTDEQLSHVFQRFYRADKSGNIPGSGLGLAIVKELMLLQGGRVEIHSQDGVGTQVVLMLPAA